MVLRSALYQFHRPPLLLPVVVVTVLVLVATVFPGMPGPAGTGDTSASVQTLAHHLLDPVGHFHDAEVRECHPYHLEGITFATTVFAAGMTLRRFSHYPPLFVQSRCDPPRPFPPR